MKSKRSHPNKITKKEAKKAWNILKKPGPIIDRLESLLKITTGIRDRPIGQGFQNDVKRIIDAAKGTE
jgi:hypothetical protein